MSRISDPRLSLLVGPLGGCPHLAGDGPRPVRPGCGLALGFLTRVSAVAPGSNVSSRERLADFHRCWLSCGRIRIWGWRADTYTQRAIPGSDLFRVRSPPQLGSHASSQAAMPAVLSASGRGTSLATAPSGTRRARASSSRTSGAAGHLAVVPASSVCWWSCLLAAVRERCCTCCCTASVASAQSPGAAPTHRPPVFRRRGSPVRKGDSR